MRYSLAINGYGRIGRCVLRALYEAGLQKEMQIVAINEPADLNTICHLTRYDSTHGRFPGQVSCGDGQVLNVNGDRISVYQQNDHSLLNWRDQHIDLVLECTGEVNTIDDAGLLLSAGSRRVLFSYPGEADLMDSTIVYGVNEARISAEQRFVSAASCTTNCIVPVIKVLDDAFGIEAGTITTIHSSMNDQPVIDAYHHTDLRKTRAAGQSIIPVDTGLARGIGRVLPHMEGVFTAHALRVATINVSAMDLVVLVRRDVNSSRVNAVLQQAAEGGLAKIMGYTTEPLASCDFNHDPRSVVVDASQTCVSNSRLVKVLCWFDNEWAYANRMLDIAMVMKQLDFESQ